jgi:hypothetical protein
MNSLGKSVTAYSYTLIALKHFLAESSENIRAYNSNSKLSLVKNLPPVTFRKEL